SRWRVRRRTWWRRAGSEDTGLETEASRAVELPAPAAGRPRSGSGKRRRPSGEPPPLPRELRRSGRFWLWVLIAVVVLFAVGLAVTTTAVAVERWDDATLRGIARVRTPWLTRLARAAAVMGSVNVNLVLRWGTILALAWFRRWRHLIVFLGAILLLGSVG